ncbi:hypothetical protein [Carboxylicivirga taeanensis]|uniref:hypothetical protein n=1 Tax=Carboxylicivirga taeanensis TaxID=1416875 RepID=UPI003F6E0EE5
MIVMFRKFKVILFSIVWLALLLTSCSDSLDLTDFVKDYSTSVRYVIEAQITTTPSKHHVIITRPAGINQPQDFQGVSGAKITLSDGENTYHFKELPSKHPKYEVFNAPYSAKISNGIYESETYFAGKEKGEYTLTVEMDSKTYTAKQSMPVAGAMTPDEFTVWQNTGWYTTDVFGQSKSSIWETGRASFDDVEIVLEGRMNFHNRYRVDEYAGYNSKDELLSSEGTILRRYTMTSGYEAYVWSVLSETRLQSLNNVRPVSLPSNFDSDEISGYFSAVSCKEYEANPESYQARDLSLFNSSKSFGTQYEKDKYSRDGRMKIEFSPLGDCELVSSSGKLYGAYEILNHKQILVYFTDKYQEVPTDLYYFYDVIMKDAEVIETGFGTVHRAGKYAVMEIRSTDSLTTADGKVWSLL